MVVFVLISRVSTLSTQDTLFGLVTGIVIFLVLLRYVSTWEGITLGLGLALPNNILFIMFKLIAFLCQLARDNAGYIFV